MTNEEILKHINVNYHSSVQIYDFFVDPLGTKDLDRTAKVIFLTHTHYDHLDVPSIEAVCNPETIFVATKDARDILEKHFKANKKIYVSPNDTFEVLGAKVEVLPAYNINKQFHKKEYGWVGYKIAYGGVTFAVVGDTDVTPELETLKCDVLFVPIGAIYTMNATEAAGLVNRISPKIVVPIHYNAIVGNKQDERVFVGGLNSNILCKTFL